MPAGELALPVLDYEFDGPDRLCRRPMTRCARPFAETGTPRLPVGLNLGAQLFWQAKRVFRQSSRQVAHDRDVSAILGLSA